MQIIKAKYIKNGVPIGRSYTFFSKEPVEVGQAIQITGNAQGIVTEINVDEKVIEPFKDKMVTISGLVKVETEPDIEE